VILQLGRIDIVMNSAFFLMKVLMKVKHVSREYFSKNEFKVPSMVAQFMVS